MSKLFQINSLEAPFPTIDRALEVGHYYLRQLSGASPVALVAIEQQGGYFVRVAYKTHSKGGRSGRKHSNNHTVEIGRISGTEHGQSEGDLCNRNGCKGVLGWQSDSEGGCTCFRNAPCAHCTSAKFGCPVCDWRDDA